MAVFHCKETVDRTLSIIRLRFKILRHQAIDNHIFRIIVTVITQCLLLAGNLLHRAWATLAEDRPPHLPIPTATTDAERQDIPSLLGIVHLLDTVHHLQAMVVLMIVAGEVATDMDMDMEGLVREMGSPIEISVMPDHD